MSDPAQHEDTAYDAIIEENDHSRWAFGTGFADALAGVDTTVPAGIDGACLAEYCLMLGDDALIMSHRLQEWVARSPELEEETALANIALDLLGQARMLLARAGRADGSDRDEDAFAFGREPAEFRNVALVEPPDDDFADAAARLLVFATWRLALLTRLRGSLDPVLAAIAAKGATELTYHRDYAAQWVVRLGDGTPESCQRMTRALRKVGPYLPELFEATPAEGELATAGVAVNPAELRVEVSAVLDEVLTAAALSRDDLAEIAPMATISARSSRERHTEHFAPLVTELQSVARALPDATW
ncbi:MAG: 1,2-phenylacetyl-CoA epoxidase subunit PaaC [Jatrophihabitans sp.]